MQLQEQALTLRFTGGVDTKSDAKTVPMVKLLALENGVFTKGTSIAKRNGYEELSFIADDGTMISTAIRLARRDDELIAFTSDGKCYVHQSDSNTWLYAGPAFSVVPTVRPGPHTSTSQTMPDHAAVSGIIAYAWEDAQGGVWWSAVDSSTGRVCRAPEQLDANGQRPRCVVVGAVIHVYWANATLGRVYVAVVNPATPSAAVSAVILADDLSTTNPVYDVCPTDRAGTPALIAWAEKATTNFRVGFVDASGVLGSPSTGHPSVFEWAASMAATSPISVAYRAGANGSVDDFAVSWWNGTDGVSLFFSTAGSVIAYTLGYQHYVGATNLQRIATAFAGTTEADGGHNLWGAFEEYNAQPSKHFVVVGALTQPGTLSGVATLRSVGLCTRAFVVGTSVFAGFVHDTTYFNTNFVYRLSDFTCIARLIPGSGMGLPARTHLASASVTGSVAAFMLAYRERLASANSDKFGAAGIRRVTLDFASTDSHQTAQLGRGLYLASACPLHYDGRVWTEQGFHVGPELMSAVSAAGGSMTSSVKYEYIVWYEWTDTQGEIHRGPTSVGLTVNMGVADTQVTLTLPTLRLTAKRHVRICVARCKGNDSTAFYRVSSLDPSTVGAVNGFVDNDASGFGSLDSLSFVDQMSDTVLATQEPLYTNGGVLSNDPVGLGASIAVGKSRLFCTDPEDPNLVRYSQQIKDGYGVEWPPELKLRCDAYGGDIRALSVMDDDVIVFKEHAPYTFGGDGPLPNGDSSQTGFTNPQRITSDIGCTDIASIVSTPMGLMFKSAKGIYLLGRDKNVEYIGAFVEAYNAQTVRRATLMEDRTAVMFLTNSGKTLYYDYFFKEWSAFTNHEGYDAAIVNGRYHYIRTDARVFRETPGVYSDAGQRITLKLETAWIHFTQHLQGFCAFWYMHLLGERKSAHQLKCFVRTEYSGAWQGPAVFDATGITSQAGWLSGTNTNWNGGIDPTVVGTQYGDGNYGAGTYGGTAPGPYQWRFHLGIEGQAIQLRFEDFETAGTYGASFELTEIVVTGGVLATTTRPTGAARTL